MNTPACRLKASWMQMGKGSKLPRYVYRVPCMPDTKMVEHLGAVKERADGRWSWWRKESASHRTWVGPFQGVADNQDSAKERVLDGWAVENELVATREFQEEEQLTPEQGCSLSQILNGGGPWPTYILKWGENMPDHIRKALKEDGEAALILDADGEVFSMIVYNDLVGMREMPVSIMRELNQRNRYV